MKFLSHRGFWKTKKEQNTLVAFKKSFMDGFGCELDIRDCEGQLVINMIYLLNHIYYLRQFFKTIKILIVMYQLLLISKLMDYKFY